MRLNVQRCALTAVARLGRICFLSWDAVLVRSCRLHCGQVADMRLLQRLMVYSAAGHCAVGSVGVIRGCVGSVKMWVFVVCGERLIRVTVSWLVLDRCVEAVWVKGGKKSVN